MGRLSSFFLFFYIYGVVLDYSTPSPPECIVYNQKSQKVVVALTRLKSQLLPSLGYEEMSGQAYSMQNYTPKTTKAKIKRNRGMQLVSL